jgi:thiol:disulfide interchange protein DsbC
MIKKSILSAMISVSILSADMGIMDRVKEVLPSTDIGDIKPTPIPDIYYVMDNSGNVMHVDIARKLIIFGEIYTNQGRGLTAEVAKTWTQTLLYQQIGKITKEQIDEMLAVALSSKVKTRYQLFEFTDPDCGYCKFAKEFLAKKNITRNVIFTPLPMHKDAKSKCISVLSAKEPFVAFMSNDASAGATAEAEKKIESMMSIGQKMGIAGTPTFWVYDSFEVKIVSVIVGSKNDELQMWIDKNNDSVNGGK